MDLTEDEVLEILDLIEKSSFDFFQVEIGDLKLTVSKGGYVPEVSDQAPALTRESVVSPPEDAPTAAAPSPAPAEPAPARQSPVDRAGLVPVIAPMVGTFYRAPDPESPPFVEKGGRVDADTTVALIEVMKVYTSVSAGVGGVISEILVANAEFIEHGQELFLIKPDGASEGEGNTA